MRNGLDDNGGQQQLSPAVLVLGLALGFLAALLRPRSWKA